MTKVMTWNIAHGGGKRLGAIADSIAEHDPDVVVITEFRLPGGAVLAADLGTRGWHHQASSEPPARTNGLLVASKLPLERRAHHLLAPGLKARWLEVCIPDAGLALSALHIPGSSDKWGKRPFWEAVVAFAGARRDEDHLLIGDFNTGKAIDAQGTPFVMGHFMDELEGLGWSDAWRRLHPEERDFTWFSRTGNGFRLDYAYFSLGLKARLLNAEHLHAGRLSKASDHSALMIALA